MAEKSDRIRSFGRKRGRRLRSHAQDLYATLLPQLGVAGWGVRVGQSASPATHSPLPNPLWLEIGFGGGEHLAHIAGANPDTAMIGCEPYVNGIAGLLKHIETENTQNIRIFTDDARLLIESLPPASLERVYILYPDPWPKARHHKRRLIQTPLLDALARVMKTGAELRIATDWADYATWIFEQILPHAAFRWSAESAQDWLKPWDGWISTRYEQKAIAEARVPTYLRFTRL